MDLRVGANVREIRKRKGTPQASLAEALGISVQQVQKYETGANRMAASAIFIAARHLGVEISALFDGVDEAKPMAVDNACLSEILAAADGVEVSLILNSLSERRRKALTEIARLLAE